MLFLSGVSFGSAIEVDCHELEQKTLQGGEFSLLLSYGGSKRK